MNGERIDRLESGGPFPFLYTEAAEGRKDPCKREISEGKLQTIRGG